MLLPPAVTPALARSGPDVAVPETAPNEPQRPPIFVLAFPKRIRILHLSQSWWELANGARARSRLPTYRTDRATRFHRLQQLREQSLLLTVWAWQSAVATAATSEFIKYPYVWRATGLLAAVIYGLETRFRIATQCP